MDARDELNHVGRVALFAITMLDLVRVLQKTEGSDLQMRIGIHCGRVAGGIIGRTRPRYFVWGRDCDVANKMESSGKAMEIQVSEPAALRLARQGFRLVPHEYVPLHDEEHGAAEDSEEESEQQGAAHPKEQWMQTYFLIGCDRVTHNTVAYTVDLRQPGVQ
jgi:hypothetical protein